MDRLSWIIELLDRASGPARKVAAALDAVRVAKDRVAKNPADRAMDSLERATASRRSARQRSLTRGIEEFARSQQRSTDWSSAWNATLSNGAAILGAVGAVAFTAAGAFASVGAAAARSAVEIAGFQESTYVAMQTMLGSRAAANAEFDRSLVVARMTPFDTRNVVAMRRGLVGSGFRDSAERDVLTGVLADVAAMNPEDSTIMQRLGLAIGQIRGAGRLRGQELNQLIQGGMSRDALFTEIGRAMNLRGTSASVNQRVAKLMEAGKITDRIAFGAMARAVMRMTNTSRVGEFSASQSTTIPGLLSTLGSAVPELLLGRDASGSRLFESAGMNAFKGMLKQFVELLSSTSTTGQRVQRILRTLIDDVFGLMNVDKSTKGGIAPMFNRALDAIERVIEAGRILAKWSASFGGGFWLVIGPALGLVASAAGWLIEVLGGDGAGAAVWIMKALGVALGGLVVLLYTLVALAALPFIVIGLAIYGVVRAVQYLVEQLDRLKGYAPDWMQRAFGWDQQPAAPALSGATPIVDRSRDPNGARPVISQPNVNINVAAMSEQGLSAQGIADAAASVIPGVVSDAAGRASA